MELDMRKANRTSNRFERERKKQMEGLAGLLFSCSVGSGGGDAAVMIGEGWRALL